MHFLVPLSLPFLVYKMGPYVFLTGLLLGLKSGNNSSLIRSGVHCLTSHWGIVQTQHLGPPASSNTEEKSGADSWAPAVRLTSGHRGPEGILQFGLVWFLFGEHSSHRAHATLNSQPPLSVRGS